MSEQTLEVQKACTENLLLEWKSGRLTVYCVSWTNKHSLSTTSPSWDPLEMYCTGSQGMYLFTCEPSTYTVVTNRSLKDIYYRGEFPWEQTYTWLAHTKSYQPLKTLIGLKYCILVDHFIRICWGNSVNIAMIHSFHLEVLIIICTAQ